MGTYLATVSDAKDIVLRHEGEDDHSIEIHAGASGGSGVGAYAPVPQHHQDAIVLGKRYYVSLSITEIKPYVSPAPKAAPVSKVTAPAKGKKKAAKSRKPSAGAQIKSEIDDASRRLRRL